MSILTSTELIHLLPKVTSDRERFDLGAGMSRALERACNRAFAKRVSAASTDTGVTTVTIPRHGFAVDDELRFYSPNTASNWNGTFTITAVVGVDDFTITLTPDSAISAAGELTVRPIREMILPTNGGHSFFVDPRPVAEVVSVELSTLDHTWADPLESVNVFLADIVRGLSFTGEVFVKDKTLPRRAGTYRYGGEFPRGVRCKFISGEPIVPQDVVHAAKVAVKNLVKRSEGNAKQSESYDYYSYTTMDSSQLSKLFGELEALIRSYRLPVV